jgi:hypothetical protein
MIVEIGAEAALFPEKEYISGIFVAVFDWEAALLTLMPWGGRQAGARGVRQSISVHVWGTSMMIWN